MQEIRRQKFGSHATMSLWMFSESITCMTLTLSGTFFGGATFLYMDPVFSLTVKSFLNIQNFCYLRFWQVILLY